jgi:tetratricopeptide (TPR) repeat protein
VSDSHNTVFISYRRSVSSFIARAIFQDLRYHGYDVFMDVESIDSGQFESIILNQIAARSHFLVILTPGAVERCAEPEDWLRREIEHAMHLERNVVPALVNDFDFRDARKYLIDGLERLQDYNSLTIPHDYFDAAMERLRTRFLKPDKAPGAISPTDTSEQAAVQQKIADAESKPVPSAEQLSSEEYYDRGHRRWENGDFEGAIVDCTKAIELNSDFTAAYNRRGTAYLQSQDFQNAMIDFDKAVRISPEYSVAHFNLGLCYAADGDYGAALRCYNEALRLNPLLVQGYYNRALAKVTRDDYRGAKNDFEKFLDMGGGEQFSNHEEVMMAIININKRLQQ